MRKNDFLLIFWRFSCKTIIFEVEPSLSSFCSHLCSNSILSDDLIFALERYISEKIFPESVNTENASDKKPAPDCLFSCYEKNILKIRNFVLTKRKT